MMGYEVAGYRDSTAYKKGTLVGYLMGATIERLRTQEKGVVGLDV